MRTTLLIAILAMTVSAFPGSRQKARERYEKGLERLRLQDLEKAAKEFRKAVKEDPGWADAHFQLAMAYLGLGKFKDAEKSNRRALELDPGLEDAQYWALFFEDRRRLADSIRYAEEGSFKPAVGPLLRFLDDGGDLLRFSEVFRNSYVDPRGVVSELVESLARSKNWDRLEEAVSIWSEISPERSGALFGRAVPALAEADQVDRALRLVDRWEALGRDATIDALSHRGWLLLRKDEEEQAKAVYGQLAEALESGSDLVCWMFSREFIEHFGGVFEEAEPIIVTVPDYPRSARGAGVTGGLTIEGVVGLDGLFHEVEVVPPGLGYGMDESALEEVGNWRFKPARINGVPIRRRTRAEVAFGAR